MYFTEVTSQGAQKENAGLTGRHKNAKSLFMLVFLASFHAFFHVVDGRIHVLDCSCAMSAFIVLGFFQMVFGLLQRFKRGLHVWLVVIIVTCDGGDGEEGRRGRR